MKRRGDGGGRPPRELVAYEVSDWVGRNDLDPGGVSDPPPVRWSRARRAWAGRARSVDELNLLYPVDMVGPPEPDPRAVQR